MVVTVSEIEARKALVKAIWACIVDASSMNVVMSGPEVNAAMDAYRDAAVADERARIAEAVRELAQHWVSGEEWDCAKSDHGDPCAVHSEWNGQAYFPPAEPMLDLAAVLAIVAEVYE